MTGAKWFIFLFFISLITAAAIKSERKNRGVLAHLKGLFNSPNVKWLKHGKFGNNKNQAGQKNRENLNMEPTELSLHPLEESFNKSLENFSEMLSTENDLTQRFGPFFPAYIRNATNYTLGPFYGSPNFQTNYGANLLNFLTSDLFNFIPAMATNFFSIPMNFFSSFGTNFFNRPTNYPSNFLNIPVDFLSSIGTSLLNLPANLLNIPANFFNLVAPNYNNIGLQPWVPAVAVGTMAALAAGAAGIGGAAGGISAAATRNEMDQFDPSDLVRFVRQETPVNNAGIPTNGPSFPGNGCASSSVRFSNELCTSLLRRGPCTSPNNWVTVDPITFQGRCSPRPCGRGRVFAESDGLCHDISDPTECQGGRRLYYSAFGNPICDCPVGQFPFPTENDNCVALFTQGPCPVGQVVTINQEDTLVCSPADCQPVNGPAGQPFQMVPVGSGECFALGTRGPCPATPVHLLGFDVFQRQAVCVNMEDSSTQFFSSPDEDALIDSFFNQLNPEFDVQVVLVQQNLLNRKDKAQRKNAGSFQLPSRFSDSLLIPCRPGNGDNGCINPLVPNVHLGTREVQQAVRSPFCGGGQWYSAAITGKIC